MKVKECMCKEVECLSKDSTVKECAKLMSDKHIGCVPVCDENKKILGIVTDRDVILRGIACDKDVNTTKLYEIMTTTVCTCNEEDTIETATKNMSENQIRRLPITDETGTVVGIISLANLCKNTETVGETLECICDCNDKNAE